MIKRWLDKNYNISGKYTVNLNSKIIDAPYAIGVEVKISASDKIKTLLPEGWKFGYVGGFFDCSGCINLRSLEGAPKEVGGSFFCNNCVKLKTLEGAPSKIDGSFSCVNCNIKSLEGAPEEVGKSFSCASCEKLTSLKGAPRIIGANLYCMECPIMDYSILDKIKIGGIVVE